MQNIYSFSCPDNLSHVNDLCKYCIFRLVFESRFCTPHQSGRYDIQTEMMDSCDECLFYICMCTCCTKELL